MNKFWQYCMMAAGGLLVGVVGLTAIRFALQPSHEVHYHANFAVFIHGQREQFKGFQYYQEEASCSAKDTPQSRVHMHDNNNHIVHVHDTRVTWADLFNNLGWVLGDHLVSDGIHAYQDGQGGKLSFVLNGKPTASIADEVIKSEDRLLISFGGEDQDGLNQQFKQIESDAHQFNEQKDPAACKGPEDTGLWPRLERALWF